MYNNLIKILIADDHRLFRDGLLNLLKSENNISIVGEAQDGAELIKKFYLLNPDIIIIDLSMPILSGVQAFSKIKITDPNVKALFLTMYDTEAYIYQALKLGVKGLLSKNIDKNELLTAIQLINEGKMFYGFNWPESKLIELKKKFESTESESTALKSTPLSEREKEILLLIAEDLTSFEISEKLNRSKRTIDNHRANIIAKLGLKSLSELDLPPKIRT